MNRRDALRTLTAIPFAGIIPAENPILFCHVTETPELVGKVRIYVDGIEQKYCTWADVRRGEAEIFPTNSRGQMMLNKNMDEIVRLTIRGKVRIERAA